MTGPRSIRRRSIFCHLVAHAALLMASPAYGQSEEVNKASARRFSENVWFANSPSVVDELVAPEYVIHDIGDLKGIARAGERAAGYRGPLLAERHAPVTARARRGRVVTL